MKAISISFVSLFICLTSAFASGGETLDARKGLFRLLSADLNEESEYALRASLEYFSDTNLWDDKRDGEGTNATIAAGYAFTPNFRLTGSSALDITSRKSGNLVQNYTQVRFAGAFTASDDLGSRMGLKDGRLLGAFSLWFDFSKPTRMFKGLSIHPQFALTSDFSDLHPVPVRFHLNAGFKPKNETRYFDETSTIRDLDRTATGTLGAYAISSGVGLEFPTNFITPSLEVLMDFVQKVGFSESPKWVTGGLKAKPFPQKNIEILAGVDVGLSSYSETSSTLSKPIVYAVPLWNVFAGFGIKQFGKLPNEVGVDRGELERQRTSLTEQREVLRNLRNDLNFNTVTGRVIDAATKQPLESVTIHFPEQADLPAFRTNAKGEFTRYFPKLEGARMQFSKEGYASSSKYLVLKPGEKVQVDIELSQAKEEAFGDLSLSVMDEKGIAVQADVSLTNVTTNEVIKAKTDASGNLNLKIAAGDYSIEIVANGLSAAKDQVQLQSGKAVLRSYTLTPQ